VLVWIALLVAVLAAAALRGLAGYSAPRERCRQLSSREVAFVEAAADASFPPGGAIPLSGTEAGIPGYVDRYLEGLTPRNRKLIRLLLAFFEHATLLFPAPGWNGWRRFTRLRPEQRAAVLEAWGRSRLRPRRMIFTSLRTILTMGYLACPAVLRRIGLAPLAMETPRVDADLLYPRVGRGRDTIPWRPEDRGDPREAAPLDPAGPLHPDYAEAP
jgi:Gluconate 2-dehydrogenase subunit 3